MRTSFSSDCLEPGTEQAAIETAFRAHVDAHVDIPADMPTSLAMDMCLLGSIHCAAIQTSPLRLWTGADEDGLLYLSMTVAGDGVIDAGGSGRRVVAGDANLMNRGRSLLTVISEPSKIISLCIPQALLLPRLADRDAVHQGGVLQSPYAARLLQGYVLSMFGCEEIGEAEGKIFAGHIVDLAALLLGPSRDARQDTPTSGLRAARRQAIKADIAVQLTNPDLSLAWMSRRHKLSSAYIRALFYDEGTSFTDYVLGERLNYARSLLTSPYLTDHNIATLALMAGFGDISWFNQAFRRRFGIKPSDLRR